MAYIKTNWLARVGTALNRFLKTNESSGSVELTADPTGVSVQGTPFTVANMNKIEQGIYDAHVVLDNNINQDVRTTASPTFATVNTGHGATEIYKETYESFALDSTVGATETLQDMVLGERKIVYASVTGTAANYCNILLPATGSYLSAESANVIAGGSAVIHTTTTKTHAKIVWRVI